MIRNAGKNFTSPEALKRLDELRKKTDEKIRQNKVGDGGKPGEPPLEIHVGGNGRVTFLSKHLIKEVKEPSGEYTPGVLSRFVSGVGWVEVPS